MSGSVAISADALPLRGLLVLSPMPDDTPNALSAEAMTAGAKARLLSFVERIERIDAAIAEEQAARAEVIKEAKGEGFNIPALKNLIARRGKDRAVIQEQDALNELYLSVIGGN